MKELTIEEVEDVLSNVLSVAIDHLKREAVLLRESPHAATRLSTLARRNFEKQYAEAIRVRDMFEDGTLVLSWEDE